MINAVVETGKDMNKKVMEHSFMTYLWSSILLTVPLTLGSFPIPFAKWTLLLHLSLIFTQQLSESPKFTDAHLGSFSKTIGY